MGELPGGAASGGGATWDVNSEDADKVGSGGLNRAKQGERESVASRRGNLDSKSSGVGSIEEASKASIVAENPRGGHQKVVGGVELPQGINATRVEELPQGGKTSGGILEGDGLPGED